MDNTELSNWVSEHLASLDENAPQLDAARAFTHLQSRITDLSLRGRRLPEESAFSLSLAGSRLTKRLWLIGAALAASACLCLLVFPTSRDVVQKLFARGSDSKLVNVGQVYADLKTMKDKQSEIDFTLKNMEGRNITLSSFKGKVVLLNFWATWCGGCRTEIPWLVQFDRKYRDKGLVVIGISEDRTDAGAAPVSKAVGSYLKNAGIKYPVAIDDGTVADRYKLFNMPATYLIDRDGTVSAASVGIIDKSECEAEIRRLLAN
jgi:thiol-disulfide isomerase/thioredoxin